MNRRVKGVPAKSMWIAVVGWGSLLWNQASLVLSSRWHTDGPRLPLEFARISRDGRLTLVLHEESPEQQSYWATSAFDNLAGARENLRERERCPTIAPIHLLTRSGQTQGAVPDAIKHRMAAWLAAHTDIDAVVWTGLGPKWNEPTPFRAPAAVAYLATLAEPMRTLAREYLTKTPPQIQTPLRQQVRDSLGWEDEPLPANALEMPDAH